MWYRSGLTLTIFLGLCRVVAAESAAVVVGGSVQDQTGAVLPGATVELVTASGSAVQATAADAVDTFRCDHVAAGQYELRAQYEGFKPVNYATYVGTWARRSSAGRCRHDRRGNCSSRRGSSSDRILTSAKERTCDTSWRC
jgi:hypothetical protein